MGPIIDVTGCGLNEAEQAWRLWHVLQDLSDALWQRYESAFMDFCGEDSTRNMEDSEPPF